jgi:hypothetical protein
MRICPFGETDQPHFLRHAQFAPFIQSRFIGRISYLAPTSSEIIGSAAVIRSTSVWSFAEKIDSPTYLGIIYRALTHDRTNFGQALKASIRARRALLRSQASHQNKKTAGSTDGPFVDSQG